MTASIIISIIALIISVVTFIKVRSIKKNDLYLTKNGKVYTIKDNTGQDIYKMTKL